ncbi:MAG TPA: hypothetical protein VMT12_03345 [Syntrophales bacterium]|nr:hypothetical protein [Syntrophales bacterium]
MSFGNQKGNVIAYVIIAMTTIAALAVGALYMTSSSALGELGANNLNRAYSLAQAGKDYALIKNLENTGGRNFTLASGDIFQLVISGNSITSTGIVNQGTPYEARRAISITKTGFGSQADISFTKDIQAFAPVQSRAGFITADTGTGTVALGHGMSGSFGAMWYGGSAVQGNCQNGKCDFGTGFRAFFVFQFASGSFGDGFTFAFFNGDGVDVNGVKNDRNSVGGDSGRGELLGYSGDSRVDSAGTSFLDGKGGRGIQPPKAAVEFDVYPNFDSDDICASGSRRDGLDSRNHVAYVFWGDNTSSSCTSTVGRNTYDDNRHNAGGVSPIETDPRNSRRPTDGADTSYFDASSLWPSQIRWMLNNTPTNIYAVRVEVTRGATPDSASGNYAYTMNTWIKQCPVNDIECPAYDDTSIFANTKINYNDMVPTDVPTLSRAFALTPALHQNFNSFYFGWTAATGGATQNVTINRFRMNFLK